MAASPNSPSLVFFLSLFSILHVGLAQSVPRPSTINITRILQKAGQYSDFIRLLNQTRVTEHIDNQVNNSYDGLTIFAPTDNAFNNLPVGTLNLLTDQQLVQLVLYHISPRFYSLRDLKTVSNPVRTQASRQDGGVYGLYFSGAANQVNVSNGRNLGVPINIAVTKNFPLAVYQLDSVLMPREFSKVTTPVPPPVHENRRGRASGRDGVIAVAPSKGNLAWNGAGNPAVAPSTSKPSGKRAMGPSTSNPSGNGDASQAVAATTGKPTGNGAGKMSPVGLEWVSWLGLLFMGILA